MSCKQSLNLNLRQSTFFQKILRFLDVDSLPIDLTGYTFFAQAKVNYSDASAAFTFDITLKNQTTNKGEVDWTLQPSDTANLVIAQTTVYLYDIIMVQPDMEPICVVYGEIALTPKITVVP